MNRRFLREQYFFVCVVSLLVFLAILYGAIFTSFIPAFDTQVHSYFLFLSSSDVARAGGWFSFLGDTLTIVFFAALLSFVLIAKKRYRALAFTLFTFASGFAVVLVLKLLVHRARPMSVLFTETDFSFPSGHAFKAMLFVLVFWFVLVRAWKSRSLKYTYFVAAFLFVALMGLARIVMGVHWASDVLAGYAFGVFWFSLCALLFERTKR